MQLANALKLSESANHTKLKKIPSKNKIRSLKVEFLNNFPRKVHIYKKKSQAKVTFSSSILEFFE